MKYQEELKKIISLIEENHIDMYFNISKDLLNKYIEELLSKYEIKDDYDLYYITNVIIKKIFGRFDSHTSLVWKDLKYILPIRVRYIDNKLYIIRTDEDNNDILYGQILKINNIDINKIIKEIENMIAYSTKGWLYSRVESIIQNGIKLRTLPSINSKTEEFELEILKDDQIINRKLKSQEKELMDINKPKENYYYEIKDDVIYIVYNSCREEYKGQMQEFVNNIKEISEKNKIKKYIIDIRNNEGGNSHIIEPLIKFLEGKNIITLINNSVFSGGRFAAVDLKNVGSILVGEEIGTTINCFGNSLRKDTSQFIIPISEKYYYFDGSKIKGISTKEDFKKFKNNPNNKKYFEPQIIEPDYYVDQSINNYINEYDNPYESALLLFKTRMKDDRKEQYEKIKTPDELMTFLEQNINYGWIDKNGKKFLNTLTKVREKSILSSMDDVFKTGLATCAETSKLIKTCLDRLGYTTKLYSYRAYETEDNFDKTIKMHCFVLYKKENKWCHFEYSMTPIKGQTVYKTLEEALTKITSMWNKNERELAEIDDIPEHITFKEFNLYINSCDLKKIKTR